MVRGTKWYVAEQHCRKMENVSKQLARWYVTENGTSGVCSNLTYHGYGQSNVWSVKLNRTALTYGLL
jgi:hypothetical protein